MAIADPTTINSDIVSAESEKLILVNPADEEVGYLSKDKCHDGDGVLHRAFSLFIFNERGELLLQKRSAQKRLWPLYWSNSVCGHPQRQESMEEAIHRRLYQEVRMTCELEYLYKFIYQAHYLHVGSEHELCSVYIGKCLDSVAANTNEIADWRFVNPTQMDNDLANSPEAFTPWTTLEWRRIRSDFQNQIAAL